MNTSPAKPALSWVPSDVPTLTLRLPQGQRYSWPIHLLLAMELHPAMAGSPERLLLQLGERIAVVTGYRLGQIETDLAALRSGMICGYDERYLSLAPLDQPFVTSVQVSSLETQLVQESAAPQRNPQ